MTDISNEEVAVAAAPPKKAGSIGVTLAAVAGLSLVAAGGGWYLGSILGPQKKAEGKVAAMQDRHDEGHGKNGQGAGGEEGATAANGVVVLQPITTNLAYPSDTWIRLEVALQFRGKPDLAVAESIHEDMAAYLRTLSLQDIEGARGFKHLRSDLEQRAVLRSQGHVERLMFRTFVVQ